MDIDLVERLKLTETEFNEKTGLPDCNPVQIMLREQIFSEERSRKKAKREKARKGQ